MNIDEFVKNEIIRDALLSIYDLTINENRLNITFKEWRGFYAVHIFCPISGEEKYKSILYARMENLLKSPIVLKYNIDQDIRLNDIDMDEDYYSSSMLNYVRATQSGQQKIFLANIYNVAERFAKRYIAAIITEIPNFHISYNHISITLSF